MPICRFQRPEDIEVLPGGKTLLVSEYGSLDGARPGRLTLFQIADGTTKTLYPKAGADVDDPRWGDEACPGPPGEQLSPHGIHHSETGGLDRVFVVNHGGREAVELFELELTDDGTPSLIWRGCVTVPESVWVNDVVGLPGGGLAITHMMPRGSSEEAINEAEISRKDTGYALEWHAGSGWNRLAGTDGGLPNGIEVSTDGGTLYLNYYFGDRVAAVDRASGERLWDVEVDAPDNSSWTAAGKLLVASHRENLEAVFACNEPGVQICPLAFAILSVDPRNGLTKTLFEGAGPPMAGATVAVEVGTTIFLGSFAGDRMARFERDTGATE